MNDAKYDWNTLSESASELDDFQWYLATRQLKLTSEVSARMTELCGRLRGSTFDCGQLDETPYDEGYADVYASEDGYTHEEVCALLGV